MNRPCECGCRFEEHEQIQIDTLKDKVTTLYCKNCDKHNMWCYFYRPCGNLKYLEYLYEQHITN